MAPLIKSVAVIGAGPAGAIAVDALAQEQSFEVIRVFERREDSGGCWLQDAPTHKHEYPSFEALASRTADTPLTPPSTLPATVPKSTQYRYSDTSIYPHLETNIDAGAMSFSQEPVPAIRSSWSIEKHGEDTPFRHWKVMKDYISSLLTRNNYPTLISYNTTVELVEKPPGSEKWIVTLRKPLPDGENDYWWTESFDAVVVASGHYIVPYIPSIPGLADFAAKYPDSVIHTKTYRSPEHYRNKRVVTVGASVSGADVAFAIAPVVSPPLHSSVRGNYHPYFSDFAFQHPNIVRHPPIARIVSTSFDGTPCRTVIFEDGTHVDDVDYLIFGTGYSWTLPFLPQVPVRNNRLPGLYQHVFWREDPTLCFSGAIAAGFTFKVYEWQSVLLARFLAGRITLPPIEEQLKWEQDRVALRGDGVKFTALYPDFEGYFEVIRRLAGEPTIIKVKDETTGEEVEKVVGRKLVKFEREWERDFEAGHLKRIEMWKRGNREFAELLRKQKVVASGGGDNALGDGKVVEAGIVVPQQS